MARRDNHSNGDTDDMPADVTVVLDEVVFPAERDDVVTIAQDADIDGELLMVIEELPDEQYQTRGDAEKAINKQRSSAHSKS
jgi:hypothetical protein